MFHSQTWLSFYDAAPKLHASAIPWMIAATAAILLVLYLAVELWAPRLEAVTSDTACLTSPADPAPAACYAAAGRADYQRWYPAVALGDLLSHH
jgi:hypothetical protein